MSDKSTEQELIEQLRSDKRSLRIQAAVKLTRSGRTKEALKALSILVTLGDREESFFASQAIAKISQKLGISSSDISSSSNSGNEISSSEFNLENLTSIDFLSASKEKAPTLLKYVREHPDKLSEEILPSVGNFLGKYGDSNDSEFIVNYLKTHFNTLTLPFITAAEKIDSKILIPVLPYLLASKEALVRSKAVMILIKIDPQEAERHFLNLLSSKQAENRLAALEISFLFPFDRVKNYIIALLSEEKDPDVFKTCATVLASNPSLEIALRLLDVLEATPAEQRKPITSIFNIVSIAIRTAKILSEKESSPQALVSIWKHQRLQKFLNDLEIQLSIATSQKKEAIINWIKKNIHVPEVAKFLDQLALNPQTENIYQRITNPKSKKNSATQETQPSSDSDNKLTTTSLEKSEPNQNSYETKNSQQSDSIEEDNSNIQNTNEEEGINSDLTKLPEVNESDITNHDNDYSDSDKEQILYLKQLDTQQFLMEKQRIFDMAEDSNISIPLRTEALNTLLKLSPSIKLKSLGLNALKDENVKIKTVGFKILERVAPDVIKEMLSDLLHSKETAIRVRAIRVGLKTDQEKSIQSLQKLISSEDQKLRSYAISCLALCPIESVYNILIRSLQEEQYPLVAKQICCVLVSNPDPMILSILDKLSIVTNNPDIAMIISQARNELEEILASLPERFKQSKLTEIDIFKKSNEVEKPYSVENVRKLTKTSLKGKKENKTEEKGIVGFIKGLSAPTIVLIVATAVLIPFILYAIYDFSTNHKTYQTKKSQSKNERSFIDPSDKKKIPGTFRFNKTCNISGKITNILPDGNNNIVIKYNGREIMVKFKGQETKGLKVGDIVSVTCIPYKENPNGIILSNGTKVSLME